MQSKNLAPMTIKFAHNLDPDLIPLECTKELVPETFLVK